MNDTSRNNVRARCTCGHWWFVGKDLVGGLTNCPRCGKATQVEGLRDGFWRLLQVGAALVWVLVVALLYTNVGVVAALIAAVVLAAFYGLVCLGL